MLCRKTFLAFLLLLPLLNLTACKSEPAPAATETPELAPLEIAARASEVMLAVEALHFIVERDGALAYIDADHMLAFKRAEGDFGAPDRLRTIVRVITAFTPIEIGMVVLGDDQYATDPITGQWGRLPPEWGQFNLLALFNQETGLQALLQDGIVDLAMVGSEEINKQRHYHLAGRASGERMSAMTMGFIGRGDVELDVWIGAEDHYVRRVIIVEPETDPDNPTTWSLEFSNLAQPVEIEAPPISQNDPGFQHINNEIAQAALVQR